MTTARFLVSSEVLSGAQAVLTGSELQHLRARRLRVGSALVLCDGLGQQRGAIVLAIDRQSAIVALAGDEPAQRESPLHLVLAQAVLKANKLDSVIEKATELGVNVVIIFTCERTIPRISAARHERWTRVARSAAKQCQRSHVPLISGPVALADVLARRDERLRLFCWEAAAPTDWRDLAPFGAVPSALVIVGPEGGFSAVEATAAHAAGFHVVGIAPRVLRAETAAIAAVTICQSLWGDVGRSNPERNAS